MTRPITRPATCRYCGLPLRQAKTGRPRQFCCDAHRRLWGELMRSLWPRQRPPFGEPAFHSRDAERRLRALHAELRSTARSCYAVANELELSGDTLDSARFGAAGSALENVLLQHFQDLEGKP